MDHSSPSSCCPKCGEPIPAEAPRGLCPKCLLQQASLPTETATEPSSPLSPPSRDELAAAFPQLEILEPIGHGGMGFVFKARQPKIERVVALKILARSLASNPTFAERFIREGRVLARLNHPNIVTLHDFGQANGFFYLLMEYVDGVNLRQAMRAGRFSPAQALAVVPKICEALQVAHAEGILHRDIKPENILLDTKGQVKIADFGIAKLVDDPPTDALKTGVGATLGTPHYMAPEQVEKPGEVDHRADIYSLGVVFYEMLTGELPLGKFQPPSQKVQVDVRLDDIVLHALEKEPARRYQQVSQVKTAVDSLSKNVEQTSGLPPVFPPTDRMHASAFGLRPKSDHFWRWVLVVLLAMGLLLVSVPILYLFLGRPPEMPMVAKPALLVPPATEPAQDSVGQLILDSVKYDVAHPEPGELRWGFKGFIPPNHLASLIFVRWVNGVPTIDPGFSTYFKVGPAGGVDIEFCSVACSRLTDSPEFMLLDDDQRKKRLETWKYPMEAGISNAVRWDVNLGAGYTVSAFRATPSYRGRDLVLPRTLQSGHQLAIRLLEFVGPEFDKTRGQSGVELHVFLEPLRVPAIRLRPGETERTGYIAGRDLIETRDETLQKLRNVPVDP